MADESSDKHLTSRNHKWLFLFLLLFVPTLFDAVAFITPALGLEQLDGWIWKTVLFVVVVAGIAVLTRIEAKDQHERDRAARAQDKLNYLNLLLESNRKDTENRIKPTLSELRSEFQPVEIQYIGLLALRSNGQPFPSGIFYTRANNQPAIRPILKEMSIWEELCPEPENMQYAIGIISLRELLDYQYLVIFSSKHTFSDEVKREVEEMVKSVMNSEIIDEHLRLLRLLAEINEDKRLIISG